MGHGSKKDTDFACTSFQLGLKVKNKNQTLATFVPYTYVDHTYIPLYIWRSHMYLPRTYRDHTCISVTTCMRARGCPSSGKSVNEAAGLNAYFYPSDNNLINKFPEQATKIAYLTLTCVKGVKLILLCLFWAYESTALF